MKDLTGKDAKRMEKLNSILLNEFCNLKAENERLAKLNETMLDNATTKGFGTTYIIFRWGSGSTGKDPQDKICNKNEKRIRNKNWVIQHLVFLSAMINDNNF